MTALRPESHTGLDRFAPLLADVSTPYFGVPITEQMVRFVPLAEDSPSVSCFASPEAATITGRALHVFCFGLNSPRNATSPDAPFPITIRAVDSPRPHVHSSRNAAAIALLRSWLNVNEQDQAEHRETLAYLREALDQDRPSNRKLFP